MKRRCCVFLILFFFAPCMSPAFELSVDQAVQIALENNLDMQLQKEQLISSGGQITQAEGEFDTLLSAEVATGNRSYSSVLSGEKSDADLTAGCCRNFRKIQYRNSLYSPGRKST